MLISCNKLKKYIKESESIDWLNIWSTFTIRTAEVEDVRVVGNTFQGVVVAEIKECVEHPNSDHLHILKVDIGKEDLVQVVCGAPNVRVGLKTAFVKVGGHIGDLEITARPLRGVESNGMCCSGLELSISDNNDGILELPNDYINGRDIKSYLPIDDIIVEIDNKSLTNRPDLWGHYGIAREICAITEHELLPLEIEKIVNNKNDLDIVVNNKELCYRYCGLTIDNITNNKTPLDMQIFLYYVGMRSISLIVDLTNYLMLELGQPMHAFDARVVKNIVVDVAHDNDTFVTLDNIKRTLTNEMLMIKNNNEYFGIAGVMGGLDSEIRSDTTSIFLESATFNAGSVRRCASKLGLRTEASARYEKSLDPNLAILAIKRFVYLLKLIDNNINITSNLTDVYPNVLESEEIILDKKTLSIYLGETLDDKKVVKILESLEFDVLVKECEYIVSVPTFRCTKDIKIKQDLIEEIARIYGLENFNPEPLKLPLISIEHENIFNQEYDIKKILAVKYDMHEVHSYIWYDTNILKELNIKKDNVKLLGKETNNILRDELSLSLLNIVKDNFRNYNAFKIFEIGTIIVNNQNKRVLSIVVGDIEKELESNYNSLKDIVKYIFKVYKNKNIEIVNNKDSLEYYDKNLSKSIYLDSVKIGEINVLNKTYTNKISKKKCILMVDIDFDMFVNINSIIKEEREISKYPEVNLDYTIDINDSKYQDLDDILKDFKSNLIKKYSLIGVYKNKYTIRYVVGRNDKTLEQKELLSFKERFISYIESKGFIIET